MKRITYLMLALVCANQSIAQSTATVYADGQETNQIVPGTKEYTVEFPINEAEANKAFAAPLNITGAVNYSLYVGGGEEEFYLDEVYYSSGSKEGYKNWKKVAKAGDIVTQTIDGDRVNDVMRRLAEKDWPDRDFEIKVWLSTDADLNGNDITLSEATINIPLSLRAGYMAKDNEEILEFYKTGNASNAINNPGLADAIESYMETKWPANDVTTVNLRYFAYKAGSNTEFKFEAYYMLTKDGICKYNSCYGRGSTSGDRYSITFFNSMNVEKKVSCDVAEQVRNR
ncbi:hypothetical protein [Marinoscillum pacificum]|uniref:hypothetical protein n=1 Tax=Marinoscillum pacificum TaxID=392723 RepID=UPI00215709AB|nr:hypothetical protein [Marinoscillum pacificum]